MRHLTGMLAAYDWEFVQQAKEIRGYAVAQLIEETKSSNANIRLKALGTARQGHGGGPVHRQDRGQEDRTVRRRDRAKIKDKLSKFMGVKTWSKS